MNKSGEETMLKVNLKGVRIDTELNHRPGLANQNWPKLDCPDKAKSAHESAVRGEKPPKYEDSEASTQ